MNEQKLFKLNNLLKEKRYSHNKFAEAIGMSGAVMSTRMNQKTTWTLTEALAIAELLRIPLGSIKDYLL